MYRPNCRFGCGKVRLKLTFVQKSSIQQALASHWLITDQGEFHLKQLSAIERLAEVSKAVFENSKAFEIATGFVSNNEYTLESVTENPDWYGDEGIKILEQARHAIQKWQPLANQFDETRTVLEEMRLQQISSLSLFERKALINLFFNEKSIFCNTIDLSKVFGIRVLEVEDSRPHNTVGADLGDAAWATKQSIPETSYLMIRDIFEKCPPQTNETWIDVGSGYGRLGLMGGTNFPHTNFIGFEIVKERVAEASRIATAFELTNSRFFQQDLSAPTFHLPVADVYFFFSPVNGETADKLVSELISNAKIKKHRVITHLAIGAMGEEKVRTLSQDHYRLVSHERFLSFYESI